MRKANISFNILLPNEDIIDYMEKMRLKAHGYEVVGDPLNTYYGTLLREQRLLMFAVLLNGTPVAGAYVSNNEHCIYIEHIFVRPEFQRTNFHFGSALIKYIISKKAAIEQYYNEELSTIKIEYINESTKHIYENLEFKEGDNPGVLSRGL